MENQKSILRLRSGSMVSVVEPSKFKNQNYNSKFKNIFKKFKFWIVILNFTFLILNFIGCATVPTREGLPTYIINGTTYLPLVTLCERQGINWDYDTFTRTVTLSKDMHKINLTVDQTLVLVDGSPLHLKHPIDIYQGTIVVPYKFKEQILDVLFKEPPLVRKTVMPLPKIKKIVIDAGHGGKDPGAMGKRGLKEKYVTLDIAKRLNNLLKSNGIEVVMTRTSDKFIPLSSRVNIANASGAEIFLSIHANANRVRSLSGFEVYYISPNVNDSKRAWLAAQDAAFLDLKDAFFQPPTQNLKAILWDMIYTYNRAESIELARSICLGIGRNLNTKILGIKGARFYVLNGVRMPAILIEIGFLSNYNEEQLLKNSYYRQKIVESIAEGINNYAEGLAMASIR